MLKEKKRVRLYEGMFIINNSLSEDARQKAIDRISKAIEGFGGEIVKVLDWGKRKLAYPIDDHREGYYYLVYFNLNSTTVKDFWSDLQLHEDLIRYMTVVTDKVRENLEFEPLSKSN